MESFQLLMESSQLDETTEDQLYQHITDGLLSQFFQESNNAVYSEEDVKYFINHVNKNIFLSRKLSSDEKDCNCISLSKLKFHLNKVLCKGWSDNEATAKPLNFYKLEVSMHAQYYNTKNILALLSYTFCPNSAVYLGA